MNSFNKKKCYKCQLLIIKTKYNQNALLHSWSQHTADNLHKRYPGILCITLIRIFLGIHAIVNTGRTCAMVPKLASKPLAVVVRCFTPLS